MKTFRIIIIFIWLILRLVNSLPRRNKSDNIQMFHKTGEAIATDQLIAKYEREHQQLYKKETKVDDYLKWPALDNKNLSNYCRKYLQSSIPARRNENACGAAIEGILQYEKENTNLNSRIIIVRCKEMKRASVIYYMTRAPESQCVFALRSKRSGRSIIFNIICKYCDFEDKPLISNLLKRKRLETFISCIHHNTGQPVAKDKYLVQYELEHLEMLRKEGKGGKCVEWSYVKTHHTLDSYCFHYIKECAPGRCREGVTGKWQIMKLQYQKLPTFKDSEVLIVKCTTRNSINSSYYITRAPEENCIYALLRKKYNQKSPMVIVFKHCDFEFPVDQNAIPQYYDTLHTSVVPKSAVKEEIFDTVDVLPLFPID